MTTQKKVTGSKWRRGRRTCSLKLERLKLTKVKWVHFIHREARSRQIKSAQRTVLSTENRAKTSLCTLVISSKLFNVPCNTQWTTPVLIVLWRENSIGRVSFWHVWRSANKHVVILHRLNVSFFDKLVHFHVFSWGFGDTKCRKLLLFSRRCWFMCEQTIVMQVAILPLNFLVCNLYDRSTWSHNAFSQGWEKPGCFQKKQPTWVFFCFFFKKTTFFCFLKRNKILCPL